MLLNTTLTIVKNCLLDCCQDSLLVTVNICLRFLKILSLDCPFQSTLRNRRAVDALRFPEFPITAHESELSFENYP